MADVEPVAAEHVHAGDVLVLDDGTVAEVDDIRHGWYWFADRHEPGVALGWRAPAGRSSGVMFRRGTDQLERLCTASRP